MRYNWVSKLSGFRLYKENPVDRYVEAYVREVKALGEQEVNNKL